MVAVVVRSRRRIVGHNVERPLFLLLFSFRPSSLPTSERRQTILLRSSPFISLPAIHHLSVPQPWFCHLNPHLPTLPRSACLASAPPTAHTFPAAKRIAQSSPVLRICRRRSRRPASNHCVATRYVTVKGGETPIQPRPGSRQPSKSDVAPIR